MHISGNLRYPELALSCMVQGTRAVLSCRFLSLIPSVVLTRKDLRKDSDVRNRPSSRSLGPAL